MRICGHWLPRDAYQQAEHGETVSFVEEAEFGDLAYFDNEEGHITHVGIVWDKGQIIHAHSHTFTDITIRMHPDVWFGHAWCEAFCSHTFGKSVMPPLTTCLQPMKCFINKQLVSFQRSKLWASWDAHFLFGVSFQVST